LGPGLSPCLIASASLTHLPFLLLPLVAVAISLVAVAVAVPLIAVIAVPLVAVAVAVALIAVVAVRIVPVKRDTRRRTENHLHARARGYDKRKPSFKTKSQSLMSLWGQGQVITKAITTQKEKRCRKR